MLLTDDLTGQVLVGRYRVLSRLGEGAMGQVWRARQLQLDRDVALKVLHTEGPVQARARRRLHREARLVARISHPHVVQVFDYGETSTGAPFLVMELVDGDVATDRMAVARSVQEVIDAVCCVLRALEAAHDKGVLHRDLKPANMMLREGDPTSLVLLDFGIAAILNEETVTDHGESVSGDARLTRDGAVVGTPLYMSPEQARGLRATERSDLYAVGVVLYQWLCGRPPFNGTAHDVMRAHVFTPPPLLEPRPGFQVPPALADVVERALEKEADQRFASAWEMRRAIEQAAVGMQVLSELSAPPEAPARPSATLELSLSGVGESGSEGLNPLGRSPFVGRARELAWLDERLTLALAGRGCVLLVEGDEGVGKSRLVEEALQRLEWSVHPLLGRASLTPAGGSPMALIRGALVEAVGARDLDEDALIRRLEPQIGPDAPAFAAWLRGSSSLVGVGGLGWHDTDLAHRVLRQLSPRRPLLLVLDDAHWADPATAAFLVQQAGALRHDPIPAALVVCRQRPQGDDPLSDLARYEGSTVHRLTLERLSVTETESLLRGLAPLDGRSAAALASRADGSPLFAVQLLHSMQERGLLRSSDRGLALTEDQDTSVLPVSLEQLLTGRLDRARDRVGPNADALLHASAVLGEEFDVPTLEAVLSAVGSGLGPSELDDGLDAFVEARVFVEPADAGVDKLAWEHPLLRAAVLDRVRRSRRQRRLCRAAAAALQDGGSSGARPIVELLLLAGDRGAAAPLAAQAGTEALAAGELSEAQRLFEVGTEDPNTAAMAWWGLGNARNDLSQTARAEEAYEAALAASTTPLERGRAWFAIGRCRYNRREGAAAITALREADAILAEVDGSEAAALRASVARTWAGCAVTLPDEPLPDVDLAALLARTDEPAHRVEVHKTTGYIRLCQDDLRGSIGAFRAALPDARRVGHRPSLADLLCDLGRACRKDGQYEAARDYLEESLALCRRVGQHRTEAEVHNELGELGRATGALDSALEHYSSAASIWEAVGNPLALVAGLNQSLVAVEAGRFAEARKLLISLRKSHGEPPAWAQVPFLLTTALAASGGGQEAAAREALSRALAQAGELDGEARSVLEQLRALATNLRQTGLVADVDAAIHGAGWSVPTAD